jgi:uncharacterized protein
MEPLYQIKVVCACCDSTFNTSRVRPSLKKAVRSDADFCSYYKELNPDYYIVRVCPNCGYASTENFNERLSDKQRKMYYEKIGDHWNERDYSGERDGKEALACFKLSLLCAQVVGEKDRVIAGLLHHIAWIYRYEGNSEQEKRFLAFALEAYVNVFQNERGAVNSARLLYLIGELNRRLGNYYEAVRWFGKVIFDRKIEDATMIRASREQWQKVREDMTMKGMELPEEMEQNGA